MRNVVEYEEENENESEITLNAGTLLGIFFGLVLVCGVFFGFGYSMGRRGTTASANTTDAAPSTNTQAETPAPQPSGAPKPSAIQALQTDNSSPDVDTPAATQTVEGQSAPEEKPVPVPAKKPAPVPAVEQAASTVKPVLKPAALPVTPVTETFMVQIAAVSHQEDANTLANALRQHGYMVSVRNEPPDKLYHVQVGPFASRDAARAMRSRLLADGYNAILKP
jgi:cell division septation protein DedD